LLEFNRLKIFNSIIPRFVNNGLVYKAMKSFIRNTTGKFKQFIFIFHWLPFYSRKKFPLDLFAGLTLAAYAIPVSLAYATLAGLPPQYGVYGYLTGGFFYALMGTGRQLAIGPTSAISLMIGISLSALSRGDIQRWIDLASLTAIMLSVISLAFYFLRMSSIFNFISSRVLLGFKAGAAITIGLTQLPRLFGVEGGGGNFFERVYLLIGQLDGSNLYVLIFGIVAIFLMIAGEKFFPDKPVTIIILVISIIIVSLIPAEKLGILTIGQIPEGLPRLHFPDFNYNDLVEVTPLAFACFLLAYIESVSTARALGQKNGYDIDARQELLALGAANLATALGNGYPVSGGLSQSAVNEKAGAQTPVSLIVASFAIAMCLLFLTGFLKNLPTVILACVVLVAVKGLIDLKEFNHLWKKNRTDLFIALVALVCVVIFGILKGVLIGAVVSLVMIIKVVSNPYIAYLGRIPGTNRYSDISRHPKNEVFPEILIFRVESPILYFNVPNIYNTAIHKIIGSENEIKVVIMDLSTSAFIDSSGARLIKRLYTEFSEMGISFRLAEAHAEVRDMLRIEDAEDLFGKISRRDSLHEVVSNCLNEHREWELEMIRGQEMNWEFQ
jgi:sulfate permease, SulP family